MKLGARLAAGSVLALVLGVTAAKDYCSFFANYYLSIARWAAASQPWTLQDAEVSTEVGQAGAYLRLRGEVRGGWTNVDPAALVATRVQVGAIAATPLIFWTIVLAWPIKTWRRRALSLFVGLPLFILVDSAATVGEMLTGFARASAILGGEESPVTAWDRWATFLESGGRVVLAVTAALAAIHGATTRSPELDGQAASGERLRSP